MRIVRHGPGEECEDLPALRRLLDAAFAGEFSHEDWEHTFGGTRFVAEVDGVPVAHGAVVPRRVWLDGSLLTIGYVEGVATSSRHRGRGYGGALMRAITAFCSERYPVSMLSTGEWGFYRRFGWVSLPVASYVRRETGLERSEEEDECLMFLLPEAGTLPVPATVACEARSGDSW
ncbi:MAG: GNAT family N-acetyltransferase [Gammaproteobacteria bacterium]